MFTDDDIPPRMREKVAASDFDHVLKFDCGEDGVIVIDHQTVTTVDKDAECTLRLSRKYLEKLLRGNLNPAMAVATGKVKIDGDMSLALQLAKLL